MVAKKTIASGLLLAAVFALANLTEGEAAENKSAADSVDSSQSAEDADGIIFERQQLMLDLDKNAVTLGKIVAGAEPKAGLAKTTRAIANAAKQSVAAFEAVVPGGRSKPEVWNNHPRFIESMQTFAIKAEEMAQAGEAGNINAVTNLMIDALPCKQCHETYRGPKPPKS